MGSLTDRLLGGGMLDPMSLTDQLLGGQSPVLNRYLNPTEEDEEREKRLRDLHQEQTAFEEIVTGGGAAGAGLASALHRGGSAVQRALTPDFLEPDHEENQRRIDEIAQDLAPADQRPFNERFREKPFTTLARTGAEAVPSLAPVLAGFAIAGPVGAAAAGGATGFVSSGYQAYDESIAQGNDEATSMALGVSVGALSALLEGIGAKGLATPLKSAFGREMTQRVARGETDTLIRQILGGSGKEALTEGYQELVAAAGELVAGKPLEEIIPTLDDRILQAGTGGALLGIGTGGAAVLRNQQRESTAGRKEQQNLLEDLRRRALEGEDLTAWIQPRQTGEWGMQALPGGEWTSEALEEAHAHMESVAVPNVLGEAERGVRQVRGGIERSANWLGAERPVLELVRSAFGDKVGDQLQDTFSYGRKATTVGRTIVDAEVRSHDNTARAPAYKDILALVAPIAEHPNTDPSNGRWLVQYAGRVDRKGKTVRDRQGRRKLPAHLEKSPGMRYLDEALWALRTDDNATLNEQMKVEREGLLAAKAAAAKQFQVSQLPEAAVATRVKQLQGRMETLHDRGVAIKAKMSVGVKQKKPLANLVAAQQKIAGELAAIDAEFISMRTSTAAAGKPFKDEISTLEGRIDEIDRHLKTSHPAQVKQARERLDWLRQHPQWQLIEKGAEAASTWAQTSITLLADADIISRDQEKRILARGKHYAPFFMATPQAQPEALRVMLTKGAEEPGHLQVGLRKNTPLMLPSEGILFQASVITRNAYEQVKKNDFLKLVEAAPSFWEEAGVSLEPIEGVHRPELHVRAMRNGEKIPVYMPEPLLRAFEQLTPAAEKILDNGVGWYLKAVANQRRATALLTPTFAVGQVFRDQPEAALFAAEVGYRPYIDMARGMVHMMTGSPEAKAFRSFGGGMGSIASTDVEHSGDMLADVAMRAREEDITNTFKLATARLHRMARVWGKQEIANQASERYFAGLFHPMARLLETLDTSTRMGVYLRGLDKGFSEAESLAVSRRGAIDFALQGKTTAMGSQVLPFMGARAQAFALNREAVKRAGRKATAGGKESEERGWTISQAVALKAGGAALMPLFYMVFLPELIHFAVNADDEEYHRREDWEKQKYYFWYQLDNGEWLKTPRPMGYLSRVFGYSVGQALEESYRDSPRTLENVLAVLQDDIPGAAEFPLGFGASQPFVIADDFLDFGIKTGGVPPGIEPLQVQMTGRTNWTHRLVVPEYQGKHVPPREQGFRTTPTLYRDFARIVPGNVEEMTWAATHPGEQLSRTANALTSGAVGSEERFSSTAKTSERLTSPLWLEQYGRFMTGSVGSEIRRTGELKGKLETGQEIALSDLPVVRNFVARAKDAPQMWSVRRVLELVEEGSAYRNLKRDPGQGLTGSQKASFEKLRVKVESGVNLGPAEEERYRRLEAKSMTPSFDDIANKETYDQIAEHAQAIRELLTEYHEARRAAADERMSEIDAELIEIAEGALAEFGNRRFTPTGVMLGAGGNEIGRPGKGWAAKFYRRLGVFEGSP